MKVCVFCNMAFEREDWACPHCHQTPQSIDGFIAFAPDLATDVEHYDPEFHRALAQLEQGHFWFEARNRLLLRTLQSLFPKPETFFEIGCGTGFVLQKLAHTLPETRIYGSDLLSAGLGFAAERVPGATLFQMDARHIPYRDEFDVIGAFDVIEHIEEDRLVLEQIFQALKPGGGLMITVPQHQFLWSTTDELSYHKRRYSRRDLVAKAEEVGFDVLNVSSFVSLLLPLMWLSRRQNRSVNSDYDLISDFRVHPVLNWVLSRVMKMEYHMLSHARISLPFGGSLLLAAKRPVGTE